MNKISLEEAKKIVAGRLRLVDEHTNLYTGTEKIFDNLITEDIPMVIIDAEPMLEVYLFHLYFLVDAYLEVVEDYKNNNPSDKKNYSVGNDIYNALEDFSLEFSPWDEVLIKQTSLKNLLFDFAEVVKKFKTSC